MEPTKILLAGIVILSNGALFVVSEAWKRTGRPAPESTRKLVHIGAGLLALPLPWIFHSHFTILAMALFFTLTLTFTRRRGHLHSVHGVERVSLGEMIYPLAIYLSFVMTASQGHRELFPIPILALALADAVAGLVGIRYGRHIFHLFGQRRSLEGSLAFLLTCTICSFVVLAASGIDAGTAAGVAVVTGIVGAALEAVSVYGTDNVTVPVGVSAVLLWMVG